MRALKLGLCNIWVVMIDFNLQQKTIQYSVTQQYMLHIHEACIYTSWQPVWYETYLWALWTCSQFEPPDMKPDN